MAELQYVENPKEKFAGMGLPIPYGKCFVEFSEAGLPLKIWSAVEAYRDRDADAYLLYDRTRHSARFDAIASNLATALMNASRIDGKNHTARIYVKEPSVYVETHGYNCVFTQRIDGRIESDGQVATQLDDLKKWTNANKKGVVSLNGLTFKNGENSHVVDDWQWEYPRHTHVENPINTVSMTATIFAKLNEVTQKYKGGEPEWMRNVFVRLIPSGKYDEDLFIGNMEYVITNGYAMYMGSESVLMCTDNPVSFSLPIDSIYAVHMANKKGKHFNWGEVMIHVDDAHATIETAYAAIRCTGESVYPSDWIVREYGTLFGFAETAIAKFDGVELTTSTTPPASKYSKGELCHFDGTRIVAGESATLTNFARAYVPDNIVWEHSIAVHDSHMMINYEGNVVIIIGLSQK